MEIGKFKLAKANLIRPPKKPTSEFITREEAEAKFPGLFNAEVNENVVTKNYEAEEYINRIKSYMQSKYIDEDFGRQLVEKKLNEMEMAPSDLDTSRINRAIGGGAIEGEDLGTREGFQDPKIEFHRSKGVLGNLNYGFDNLSKDLKAGKTTNQIANELYEKNKNFPEKFKTDRIQKLNPVVLVESALKERVTKQPDFLKLSNKNKEVFNSKKEKALKDFNSFIENNKSKYKKMYDQNIAGAPEKFKQDLKSFLEKKYPEFIKESGGSTFVTKGTKLFIPIKDLGREVTQAGDYGIEKYINNTIRESLGIPLKPKAGEGSSLDRLQRKYNLSTQKLLDAAKKQGIIPEKDPITGNPINSESAYYRYVKRTEVDPIYKLFDKRFKFGGEHLGGISRAFNIGDTEALTKITAIDPYVNRVVKGGNLDKKVSTQINLAKQTGNKKYLNIANDLIKQGEKDFGLQLTKYKFKDNKIVAVHPKVSMDDPIVKKAERAILSFIATGRDKTKNFELLPEELKQSIQLFKENNLPKARKFLNQAIKTGKVASVVGIAGLASLETQAEAAGEETKTGSILPSDTYPSAPPSVLNKKEETNLNLPPEAALAGAATYKYGPQLLKILKSLGSGAFRTFGSPLVSSLYGASEILDYDPKNEYGIINPRNYKVQEDPDVRMAGLSLLLPDIAQKVTGPAATSAATGIKGFLSKAGRVALNPYFKAARLFTPVGLGIAGVGQAYDFYKQYQDLQKLKEEDPEAYEKFRRSRVDDEITAQEISTIEDMGREGAMYGGRVNYAGGGMDMGGEPDSQGNTGPSRNGNNFKSDPDDNREQYGAQGQYSRPPSTPSDGGGDNKINLINTLNKFKPDTFVNPYNFSVDLNKNIGPFGLNSFINTLGILGIDDPRTPEDESEQDDYGISASYIRDLLGGDLVGFNKDLLGGTLGLGAGYSPTTGTNLGLSFSKQFNQGGRVEYRYGGDTIGGINDKSVSSPGPDRSKVSAQQERSHQAAVREAQNYNASTPPKTSAYEKIKALGTVPLNLIGGIFGNPFDPTKPHQVINTKAQMDYLNYLANQKNEDTGTLSYGDYGTQFNLSDLKDPIAFSTAMTMGGTGYKKSDTGDITYTGGTYDFDGAVPFVDQGGLMGWAYRGGEYLANKFNPARLANGGRIGFADGPKDPGKRKTMKILAGLASLPIVGRFFDVAQVAEKAAPAVVETFKNAPAHFIGLVNKIRALGRIIDPKKLLRYDKEKISNVYDYGDYRMYEKLDGGVEIQKEKFMGTNYGDAKVSEEYMSYNPKTPKFNKKGEKIPDEYEEVYEEYTAYPDSEGKMKDIYESVEPSTIDEGTYSKEELEQLIVEQIENNLKKGKK
jgi:hypothetical protein